MPTLGTTEIIIIAVVVLILFGTKKLPDASRALGRSMRIFKSETKGLRDDDDTSTTTSTSTSTSTEQSKDREHQPASPQQLSSATDDAPFVNGKVVDRDQANQQSR